MLDNTNLHINKNKKGQDKNDISVITEAISERIKIFAGLYPNHIDLLELIFSAENKETLISTDYELNDKFISLTEKYEKNKSLLHDTKALIDSEIDLLELRAEGLNITINLRELLEENLVLN